MILTEYVMYRGKKKLVSELSPTSSYKVDVECPCCKNIRSAYYRVVVKGNHKCHKCSIKEKRRKYLDIGDIYGRLEVIAHSDNSGYSICRCECGQTKEIPNEALKNGSSKSCGCLRRENKIHCDISGENHPNWNGGISGERNRFMQTYEYKKWRKEVFDRDNYTCQNCGNVGYNLNAHHILSYSENEESRLNVDNGITFCVECHKEFHKLYGNKNISAIDILDFFKMNHSEWCSMNSYDGWLKYGNCYNLRNKYISALRRELNEFYKQEVKNETI